MKLATTYKIVNKNGEKINIEFNFYYYSYYYNAIKNLLLHFHNLHSYILMDTYINRFPYNKHVQKPNSLRCKLTMAISPSRALLFFCSRKYFFIVSQWRKKNSIINNSKSIKNKTNEDERKIKNIVFVVSLIK